MTWPLGGCGADPGSSSSDPAGDDDDTAQAPPASIDLGDISSLEIQGSRASATIRGEIGGETIRILAVPEGEGELAQPIAAGYSISIHEGRVVIAATELDAEEGQGIDFYIDAPGALEVLAITEQGSIQLDSMTSGGHLQTGTGSVVGSGLLGDFSVAVDVGAVDLQASLLPWGAVDVTVGTGPITLSVPTTTSAQLEASTTDGSVSFIDLDFVGANTGGLASGLLGAGEGTIELTSEAGDITVIGLP